MSKSIMLQSYYYPSLFWLLGYGDSLYVFITLLASYTVYPKLTFVLLLLLLLLIIIFVGLLKYHSGPVFKSVLHDTTVINSADEYEHEYGYSERKKD